MSAAANALEVLLPVRGLAPWLEDSLCSIAAQTRRPDRLTIIDDGIERPDLVAAMGERLLGNRFRMIRSAEPGISAALNTGVRQSLCTWIARMDADDLALPERLQRQLECLAAGPPLLAVCGTQVEYISARGRHMGSSHNPCHHDRILEQLSYRTCFVHPTLVFSRAALLEIPYRSAFDGAEDTDLLLRLSRSCRFVNLDERLLKYRVHGAQASFTARPRQTALQELAMRCHRARQAGQPDPVDEQPALAEQFVAWRLSDRAYTTTRMLLTALRHLRMYLRAREWRDARTAAAACAHNLHPCMRSAGIFWRIARHGPASMLNDVTPFTALNAPVQD